jgi:hypothetical protein
MIRPWAGKHGDRAKATQAAPGEAVEAYFDKSVQLAEQWQTPIQMRM